VNSESANRSFAPTRWTLVLRCRGDSEEARAALSELCGIYYRPVFEYLKHDCGDEEKARELAHEFFARILQRGGINNVDPQRGRFRSYLLGALKHFIIERHRFENRKKRGGNVLTESIDEKVELDDDEVERQIPDTSRSQLELLFDREWALTVLERALKEVENKYNEEGKSQLFELLKLWLAPCETALSQREVAEKLGMSESAVKVAIHRLRQRFREAVKYQLAQTVHDPSEIKDELNYLIEVVSQK